MSDSRSPVATVIAGPNGAGKTTFSTRFLRDYLDCREFLNADLIAAGLSPFAPQTQSVRAGRLLLTRIAELTEARRHFAFETTLAGRAYLRTLTRMRVIGYRVHMHFLWLPDVEIAVQRVRTRAQQGGHDVPEADVRRRWRSGLANLRRYYEPLLDKLDLHDASHYPPVVFASRTATCMSVFQESTLERFENACRAATEQGPRDSARRGGDAARDA